MAIKLRAVPEDDVFWGDAAQIINDNFNKLNQNFLGDVPKDDQTYGVKNGEWTVISEHGNLDGGNAFSKYAGSYNVDGGDAYGKTLQNLLITERV